MIGINEFLHSFIVLLPFPILRHSVKTKSVCIMSTKYVKHARDARNGQYVSMDFAKKHPNITVIERDKIKR